MSKSFMAALLAGSLLTPAASSASSWSLGTHFGFSILQSRTQGAGSSSSLGWPATALTYQPGIRVAFGDAEHRNEWLVDSGLFFIDEAGSSYRSLVGSFGYQSCFGAQDRSTPFANVCIGFLHEGGAGQTSFAGSLGAGIGMRRTIGDGHGAVRAEARFDLLMRDTTTGRPGLKMFGVRLGFDLWE